MEVYFWNRFGFWLAGCNRTAWITWIQWQEELGWRWVRRRKQGRGTGCGRFKYLTLKVMSQWDLPWRWCYRARHRGLPELTLRLICSHLSFFLVFSQIATSSSSSLHIHQAKLRPLAFSLSIFKPPRHREVPVFCVASSPTQQVPIAKDFLFS